MNCIQWLYWKRGIVFSIQNYYDERKPLFEGFVATYAYDETFFMYDGVPVHKNEVIKKFFASNISVAW